MHTFQDKTSILISLTSAPIKPDSTGGEKKKKNLNSTPGALFSIFLYLFICLFSFGMFVL
jgi:hypothetical protein